TSYVKLINRPFGRVAQTLHEVIWSASRRRKALRFDSKLVESVRLTSARDLDAQAFADHRQAVEQFTHHLSQILGPRQKVVEHPWFGVTNTDLTFLDADSVLRDLLTLDKAVDSLEQVVRACDALLGQVWMPTSLEGLQALSATLERLPIKARDIVP